MSGSTSKPGQPDASTVQLTNSITSRLVQMQTSVCRHLFSICNQYLGLKLCIKLLLKHMKIINNMCLATTNTISFMSSIRVATGQGKFPGKELVI